LRSRLRPHARRAIAGPYQIHRVRQFGRRRLLMTLSRQPPALLTLAVGFAGALPAALLCDVASCAPNRCCSSELIWNLYRPSNAIWSLSYFCRSVGNCPLSTQRSWSRLNKPDGMLVPGLINAGSTTHRLVHSGFNRSRASKKLGAVAFTSWAGSPVIWHFKQGAA